MTVAARIVSILLALSCSGCRLGDVRNLIMHPRSGAEITDADLRELALIDDMVFNSRRPAVIGRYHGISVTNRDPCNSDLCGTPGPVELTLDVPITRCTAVHGVIGTRQYAGEGELPAYQICVPSAYSSARMAAEKLKWQEQQKHSPNPYVRQ